jgi:hypothetical protein
VPEPDEPPTTSDVAKPARSSQRPAWKVGCAVVAGIAVSLFFGFWWLVQPGGLLHDSFTPR